MEFATVIVDDDEMCLLLHEHFIKSTNFHDAPQTFNGGQKALDYLVDLPDNKVPVILFLDINMPIMSGWDLLDILQKEDFGKKVYVIIVSSSVDAADKKKAFSFSKVIDFVEKPFDETAIEILKLKLPWLKQSHM
jgi:CheY-like chemotaxis protein